MIGDPDRKDRDIANKILARPAADAEKYKNDLASFYRKKEEGASFMEFDIDELHAGMGFDITKAKIDNRFIP